MNIRTLLGSISILSLSLVLSGSAAEGNDDFGRRGPYLRGGVAAAFDASALIPVNTDGGWGVGIAAGYRVHRNIAVEGLYQWLGESKIAGVPFLKRWDVTGNVKVSTSGRVQPYAVVGVGYSSAEVSLVGARTGAFVARFGGGVDVYIVKYLAVYGEAAYALTTGNLVNLPYATFSAGAIVRF